MQSTGLRAGPRRLAVRRPLRPQPAGWFSADRPAAPDVFYRNPPAIASRLRLFHLMRLQAQERIDADILRSSAMAASDALHKNTTNVAYATEEEPSGVLTNGAHCTVSFQWSSGVPGSGREYNPMQSSRIRMSVQVDRLGLEPNEQDALIRIANAAGCTILPRGSTCNAQPHCGNGSRPIDDDASGLASYAAPNGVLSFTVSSYPFVRQNASEAFAIVRDLVSHAKNLAGKLPDVNLEEPTVLSQKLTRARVAPMRWLPRPSLKFPSEWLRQGKSAQS